MRRWIILGDGWCKYALLVPAMRQNPPSMRDMMVYPMRVALILGVMMHKELTRRYMSMVCRPQCVCAFGDAHWTRYDAAQPLINPLRGR